VAWGPLDATAEVVVHADEIRLPASASAHLAGLDRAVCVSVHAPAHRGVQEQPVEQVVGVDGAAPVGIAALVGRRERHQVLDEADA